MSRKHNDLGEALIPSIHGTVAGQLADAMRQKNITKGEMAALLKTSRAQVNRLLNPSHNPSLSSLKRTAAIVGLRVGIELV